MPVAYFVGEWEVRAERYQGTLLVEVFANDDGAADPLSRAVEAALLQPGGGGPVGLNEIQPTSWLPIDAGGVDRASGRGRALAFTFDYELVEPLIGAGGGLISTVSVDSAFGAEHFDVQREGSTP